MSIEPRFFDKKLIFICSPIDDDIEKTTANERRYCEFVFACGAVAFAPHLYFPQFLDYTNDEQFKTAIGAGLVVLAECDELWTFGDKLTDDMRMTLKVADRLSMPMRFFGDDLTEEVCLDDYR